MKLRMTRDPGPVPHARAWSKVEEVQNASPVGLMFVMNPSTVRVTVTNHLGQTMTYERVGEHDEQGT